MLLLNVLRQNVPPEISVEFPPDRMDMIGVVLGIVILKHKGGTL